MQIKNIKLNLIDRPVDPVRGSIDPEGIRELAESIREQGLLQHILSRPANGRFEVVWGDRRYLAHKFLDADTIRSEVRDLTDEQVLILRATENDQREDLTPMERARVYGRMKDQLSYTVERIARTMGRSTVTIKTYIDLLDFEPYLQEAVDNKKIAISTAAELRKIDDPEFRKYYSESAVQNGATKEVALQWVADYEKSKAAKYYAEGGGLAVIGLSAEVAPTFLTCAGCNGPVELRVARSFFFCLECQKEILSK